MFGRSLAIIAIFGLAAADLMVLSISRADSVPHVEKAFTLAEAGHLSKKHPGPNVSGQIVFHYDPSMKPTYIYSLQNQIKKLRSNGYYAVAVPGGPKDSVQIIVAGKTADQLIFKGVDILGRKPQDYGATLYRKYIGKPETSPIKDDPS